MLVGAMVSFRYKVAYLTFIPDADECRINHGGCEFSCNNTKSSYYCSCRSGYRLAADKHSCEDIDECQTHTHQCPGKGIGMIQCQLLSLVPEGWLQYEIMA